MINAPMTTKQLIYTTETAKILGIIKASRLTKGFKKYAKINAWPKTGLGRSCLPRVRLGRLKGATACQNHSEERMESLLALHRPSEKHRRPLLRHQ